VHTEEKSFCIWTGIKGISDALMFLPVLHEMIKEIQSLYPQSIYEELCVCVSNFNTIVICIAMCIGPFLSHWIIVSKSFSNALIIHAIICFNYALLYLIYLNGFKDMYNSFGGSYNISS
jgi:hypothetical protein